MTGPQSEPRQLDPQQLADAEDALADVRETLMAAGRGEAAPSDVKESFERYLHDHGPTLEQAAGALSEEVRREALSELYKWRDQLNAQRRSQSPD